MDGVIADFTTAYLKLVNSNKKCSDITDWNLYLFTKQTEMQFWNTLDLAGEDFWTNIPIYDYSIDFVKKLRSTDDVTILTSVSEHAKLAATGKIKWLNKYISPMIPICIDPDKWKYASKNTTLIDDKADNIEKFIQNGGKGLLFKQPWNENTNLPYFNKWW
jgi:5'(3')-deoxyribonucleotidase